MRPSFDTKAPENLECIAEKPELSLFFTQGHQSNSTKSKLTENKKITLKSNFVETKKC